MRRTISTLLILAFTVIPFIIPIHVQAASLGIQVATQGGEQLDLQKAHRTLDGRFIAGDNGAVADTKTSLEWFVGPDRNTTWDEANHWVESLSVDGGGWRMPTREDLKTLYADGAGTRNMSPLFKTTGGFVWTCETMGSSYAWGFCFDIGDEYWPRRTYSDPARVFAVRSLK